MSVAKTLPPVATFFLQECPFCGTKQRMMIRGNYIEKDTYIKFPDMGYSFCNCKHIFYTKWENVIHSEEQDWNSYFNPLSELRWKFHRMDDGEELTITMLDPYFINWNAPHNMWHWNCRKVYMLWDMDSFVDECKTAGFQVLSAIRDMDVESKTPERFHIRVRKP